MKQVLGLVFMTMLASAAGPEFRVERPGPDRFRVAGTHQVDAPPSVVWDVLTDYPHVPSFSPSIKDSQVLARQGRTVAVRQVVESGFLVFRRRFVMEMSLTETPGKRLDFEETSHKDFRTYRGHWELKPAGSGTAIEFGLESEIELGPVVGWVAGGLMKSYERDAWSKLRAEILARKSRLPQSP